MWKAAGGRAKGKGFLIGMAHKLLFFIFIYLYIILYDEIL